MRIKRNTEVINLDNCSLSDRNGIYGGNAGDKEGIIFENNYWFVKYPKNIRELKNIDMSYSTSPLSEFIGSHIYDILGYDVHETFLGKRNNKIVVACKDFCKKRGSLMEMRTLKNVYNEKLREELDQTFSSTSDSHKIEIDEIVTHLKYNPILSNINGISTRFWDMMVIDIFIANNDRNNGNWGVLYDNDKYELAPIFDNGSSFHNRTSDEKMKKMMVNEKNFDGTMINTMTTFSKDGHELTAKKIILSDEYPELNEAIKRNVPLIKDCFDKIKKMIIDIPNEYDGIEIMSDIRKEYYIKTCLWNRCTRYEGRSRGYSTRIRKGRY